MRSLARAGAVALATVGGLLCLDQGPARGSEPVAVERANVALSDSDIAQIKDTLKITPAQERFWAPFAAALRDIARRHVRGESNTAEAAAGMAKRAASVAGKAVSYKRLAMAAAPLIRSFDETQRRDAMMLARAFGFEHLAAAF